MGNPSHDVAVTRLISAGSKRIANWLKRAYPNGDAALALLSREEFFSPTPGQLDFYPVAYPIAEIEALHYDFTGKYAGQEVEIPADNYLISDDLRSIHLINFPALDQLQRQTQTPPVAQRGVRATLTAGLAVHPTLSIRAITPIATAMTVGNYVQGVLSGAIGYLIATSTTSISFELLSGVPQQGETVTEYDGWTFGLETSGPGTSTGKTAVLGAATQRSLAETHPDLVEAAEAHVDWSRRNRLDPENVIITREGVNKMSAADMQKDFFSIPYIRDLLDTYLNKMKDPR